MDDYDKIIAIESEKEIRRMKGHPPPFYDEDKDEYIFETIDIPNIKMKYYYDGNRKIFL